MGNNYTILTEKNFETVKQTFEGDLRLFNHYLIHNETQIIDEDDVKYLIYIKEQEVYIVVTKTTFNELIEKLYKEDE